MTRIIAGQFRGRRLSVPSGQSVRPTTDRMRERLFSMLGHARYPAIADAKVADIFAGTGALGLEALSRGAAHVTFVENARPSLAVLRANIQTLGVGDISNVLAISAEALPVAKDTYDYIFMDPPYRQGLVTKALRRLQTHGWTSPDTVIICELASDETLELPAGCELLDDRSQGQQRILFLTLPNPA